MIKGDIMSKLYVMVGISSSGKSTFIKNNFTNGEKIQSSDMLRLEMFGFLNQTKNSELFQELHRRIKKDLLDGYNVVFDACNISRKRRTQFLKEINPLSL